VHGPQRAGYAVARVPDQASSGKGNSATRRLFESGKSRFRGLDTESALELLAILNAAERLDHISPLKSVGLHALKGNRGGQWAITVNGPWRICFRFKSGDAYEVEIVDYH
jgi:proteic killer suppression protein